MSHMLPVAAIPKGSRVAAVDVDDSNVEPDVDTYLIREVRTSEPRAGLITWETDHGPRVMHANQRVRVDLPPRRPVETGGTNPRPARRKL